MRIIAGKYRGRVLKSPTTLKTRPTSDRLRESLFNIINSRISGETKFLDLCAGTGAIGIEALSRGARQAVFVEISRKICALIEENLDNLSIPDEQTEIYCEKAEKFISRNKISFEIIYFDPPYTADYLDILHRIGDSAATHLSQSGLLIAEHSSKVRMPDEAGTLRRWRIVRQGDSSLSFYEER